MKNHVPVLLKEVISLVKIKSGDVVVDCTLGDGGYTKKLSELVGEKGKVIALDFDKENMEKAKHEKARNIILVRENFKNIKKVLQKLKLEKVSMVIADLGFSSSQLETVKGLSFQKEGLLDMRLDNRISFTAADIVNKFPGKELEKIFYKYGEEKRAKEITAEIVEQRKIKKIKTASNLVKIIRKCYKGREKISGLDVSTKSFMALRIAVNNELENLRIMLDEALPCLKKGGKIAIISFHSLEDRIVKNFFRKESRNCICGSEEIRCSCKHQASLKIINKKPITASQEERKNNPRSGSAKLRVAEKL